MMEQKKMENGICRDDEDDLEIFSFEIEEKQSLISGPSRAEPTKDDGWGEEDDNIEAKTEPEDLVPPWRTCAALCIATIFSYSAFAAITNLQSSLNSTGHMGEVGLSMVHFAVQVGSLLAPSVARLISHKGLLICSYVMHLIYTCTNAFPSWTTILIVSVGQGLWMGGIGMSSCIYINAMSTSYVFYRNQPKSKLFAALSVFNGLYFSSIKATQITGNLMSSVILQTSNYNESTLMENKCGAKICSTADSTPEFDRPSDQLLDILFGSFAMCNIAGLLIMTFGLPYINRSSKEEENKGVCDLLKTHTGGSLFIMFNKKFAVLVPFIMGQSSVRISIFAGYTKAFISCAAGVQWVGYSMVALGVVSTTIGLLMSYLARYTGRIALFVTGMGLDISTVVIMLVWEPDYTTSPMALMIVPMMAGAAQGILQPQQSALIGSVFSRKELPSAYAAASGIRSLGFCFYLWVSSSACLSSGLLLTMVFYVPGILGYTYTEIRERTVDKNKK